MIIKVDAFVGNESLISMSKSWEYLYDVANLVIYLQCNCWQVPCWSKKGCLGCFLRCFCHVGCPYLCHQSFIWAWDDWIVLQRVRMSDLSDNTQSLLWISSGWGSEFCVFFLISSIVEGFDMQHCSEHHKVICIKLITSQGGLLMILGQF